MPISLIIFLVGCSSVINNSIVEKNNATSEQFKKTNIFYYYVNPDNEYQAMDVVKGRFAWQDGYTPREPAILPFKPINRPLITDCICGTTHNRPLALIL